MRKEMWRKLTSIRETICGPVLGRLTFLFLAMAAGFIGGMLSGHPVQATNGQIEDVISVRELKVVDEQGKTVAILGEYNGLPSLEFIDTEKDLTPLMLGLVPVHGPYIQLERSDSASVFMAASEEGLGLSIGKSSNPQFEVIVDEIGAHLKMNDGNASEYSLGIHSSQACFSYGDKIVLGLGLFGKKRGMFIADTNGAVRLASVLRNEEFPSVDIVDTNEVIRATMGCTSLETISTGNVTSRSASSLVLFDKEGKVLWSAP